MATIRIRRSEESGQFYFVVLADNGLTLAHSETYRNKGDCQHAAHIVSHGPHEIKDEANGQEG